MAKQAALMARRARQFESMANYLHAKMAWLENGKTSERPDFAAYMADGAASAPRSPSRRAPAKTSA